MRLQSLHNCTRTMTIACTAFVAAQANAQSRSHGCLGDHDGNHIVDFLDITWVLGHWLAPCNFTCITATLSNWLGSVFDCTLTATSLAEPPELHATPATPSTQSEFVLVDAEGDWSGYVYGFSGEVYHTAIDLVSDGPGLRFIWSRKYRSRIGPDTAQGNGWDYSYNIAVVPDGDDLILFDGNSRGDRYTYDTTNDVWSSEDFTREIRQQADQSYTVQFQDSGIWQLHALDGTPIAGKIEAIEDRRGRFMAFGYDSEGRLTSVADGASFREATITYNMFNGRIETVTDWNGRQVVYEYYDRGSDQGSFGDLKSVTLGFNEAGSEHPVGERYTYSSGFADPHLNHNLLTIEDLNGVIRLTNIYSEALDPDMLNFDRVERQLYDAETRATDFAYESVVSDASDGSTLTELIATNSDGSVEQWLYDDQNNVLGSR